MFADDVPIFGGQAAAGIVNAAGQPLVFNQAGRLTPSPTAN
jgi:hypothetical protein